WHRGASDAARRGAAAAGVLPARGGPRAGRSHARRRLGRHVVLSHAARSDLHTHTTASDGTLTPAELVRAALDAGVEVLAVTDHDTVAGAAPPIEAAIGTGLPVLPGVELRALASAG